MNFSDGLRSFCKPCSKKIVKFAQYLGARTNLMIQSTSGYDTVSFSHLATIILVQWLSQIYNIHTGKTLAGISRSSHQRCSMKKGVLRNFAKFTEKHLCQSLLFNKVAGLTQQ